MLTSASIRPKCAAASSIAVLACAASERSTPPSSIWFGARAGCGGDAWSMAATLAPRAMALSATTLPSAPEAPVMAMTFPFMIGLRMGSELSRRFGGRASPEGELSDQAFDVEFDSGHFRNQFDIAGADGTAAVAHIGGLHL